MISELAKNKFRSIDNLLQNENYDVEVKSVIRGNNPGRVFVDDPENPQTAMIWANGIEGFYLIGQEKNPKFNNHLDQYIERVIRPLAIESGLDWFEVSGNNPTWAIEIPKIFQNRQLTKSYQSVYRIKDLNSVPVSINSPETGFQVLRLNRVIFDSDKIENIDFLVSKILLFWDSIDNFLDKGFGFYILANNLIVSLCFSAFVADNIQAIDIETQPEYRRKGLGRQVALKYMDYCRRQRLLPHWDCMKENIASALLAESIGFSKYFDYALFYFPF
ncbi:MAG: GNAT family N-acetyltransferase [Planctomycetes bacterium]|nr:GNAT family N-acetyltransferase [Planctomycetota bacterium]